MSNPWDDWSIYETIRSRDCDKILSMVKEIDKDGFDYLKDDDCAVFEVALSHKNVEIISALIDRDKDYCFNRMLYIPANDDYENMKFLIDSGLLIYLTRKYGYEEIMSYHFEVESQEMAELIAKVTDIRQSNNQFMQKSIRKAKFLRKMNDLFE